MNNRNYFRSCLLYTSDAADDRISVDLGGRGIIKKNVFVGSNSSLVAPLVIEENSVVGAGSVITKNIVKNSLALTRSPQITKKNYKRKKK